MKKVIRVAVIGMGGFAGSHQRAVKLLEEAGECKLVCSCDPDLGKFAEKMQEWEYAAREVQVFDDYQAMLKTCAKDLDMVAIPTPVPLHAPMHKACVAHGLAVYLEKPPTLDYQELELMSEVEKQAKLQTHVGFNHMVETTRHAVKQRVLKGEFGKLQEVGFRGLLGRTEGYFQRADWAGRLILRDRLVLDSGMGNAMAHHAHNSLFWAGSPGLLDRADISYVEAEMYRAHEIEGTDTIFCRAKLINGVNLTMVFSHSCFDRSRSEWLICENARINWDGGGGYKILWQDGREETFPAASTDLTLNHQAYYAYLRGEKERPLTRLADTRSFVQLCDLVYVAAGQIHTVPAKYVRKTVLEGDQTKSLQIENLTEVTDTFLQDGIWPSKQANVPWGRTGGRASLSDLPRLNEVVRRMARERNFTVEDT